MKNPRSRTSELLVLMTLTAVLACSLAMPAEASADGRKVALVIGNTNYLKVVRLPNPGNDASDIAAVLAKLGFELITLIDATQSQMDEAVESFRAKLVAAEAGLFYYAGHGVQSQGVNYLIPVDANISAEYQLRSKTMDAAMVLEAMSASGCQLNIAILDACRDNPFALMRSMSRGLTVMGVAPTGAIIVYATDPGRAAQDGSGRNGVFTASLLRHIGEVGVDVKAMFDRVGAEVAEATANAQSPWISSKFYGTYYLAGAGVVAADNAVSTVPGEPEKEPVSTMLKDHGSMTIEIHSAGTLYVNGTLLGEFPAGSTARVDKIEEGKVQLEMRYASGSGETRTVEVTKNTVGVVTFRDLMLPSGPHGWLGAQVSDLESPSTNGFAKDLKVEGETGAFVPNVYKGSPADKAGLLPGDFIAKVDGQGVHSREHLQQMINGFAEGSTHEFEVIRNGSRKKLTAKIGFRDKMDEIVQFKNLWPGMSVAKLTDEVRSAAKVPAGVDGILVGRVISLETPAAKAGFLDGDVVTAINGKNVRTMMDYYRLINDSTKKDVTFRINRKNIEVTIVLAH